MAVWQIATMRARMTGAMFPAIDAIAVRAWELITDPLMRALAENPNLSVGEWFYWLFKAQSYSIRSPLHYSLVFP